MDSKVADYQVPEARTKEVVASYSGGKCDSYADSPTLADAILSASALAPVEKEYGRVNDIVSTRDGRRFRVHLPDVPFKHLTKSMPTPAHCLGCAPS